MSERNNNCLSTSPMPYIYRFGDTSVVHLYRQLYYANHLLDSCHILDVLLNLYVNNGSIYEKFIIFIPFTEVFYLPTGGLLLKLQVKGSSESAFTQAQRDNV